MQGWWSWLPLCGGRGLTSGGGPTPSGTLGPAQCPANKGYHWAVFPGIPRGQASTPVQAPALHPPISSKARIRNVAGPAGKQWPDTGERLTTP